MYGMLQGFLARTITKGTLEVVDAGGQAHRFGDGTGDPIKVRFTTEAAERAVTHDPDLRLGEAFTDGTFQVEMGSIYDFLLMVIDNAHHKLPPWPAIGHAIWRHATRRLRQHNNRANARKNVHSHYDLDGRLYNLFLDADMQYSCAYFEDGVTSLDEAQLAKKRHLAAKLAIEPGQRILDIGCGWGGLGLYLAENFDVEVVGVTLSDEQHAVANRRAVERGLSSKARFLLQDYRTVAGPFDRIISVGMFEHVGVGYFRNYFRSCRELLTPDGVMMLHSIGRAGGPGDTSAWIQQYIFPGGYIPALSEVIPAIEKTGLKVTDVEILRLHYAKTLRLWRERFLAHREEVAGLYDERFCRLWEFYLAASEVAFRVGSMMNIQIQFTRHQGALPLTRRYMTETEEKLRAVDGRVSGPSRLAAE